MFFCRPGMPPVLNGYPFFLRNAATHSCAHDHPSGRFRTASSHRAVERRIIQWRSSVPALCDQDAVRIETRITTHRRTSLGRAARWIVQRRRSLRAEEAAGCRVCAGNEKSEKIERFSSSISAVTGVPVVPFTFKVMAACVRRRYNRQEHADDRTGLTGRSSAGGSGRAGFSSYERLARKTSVSGSRNRIRAGHVIFSYTFFLMKMTV